MLFIESYPDGKNTLARSHVAQICVVIACSVTETITFAVESDERHKNDGRVYCRLRFERLVQAEFSLFKGGAWRPFPEGESQGFPCAGQRNAKTLCVESGEKGKRIELIVKRMIAAYGASVTERSNE